MIAPHPPEPLPRALWAAAVPRCARIALRLQHTHRSTKPVNLPPAGAQRSTTESTRPGVPPPRRWPRRRSQASLGPSATTSTRPSSRFVAAPDNPSSRARARVHQRKPTPWTCPRTQAVIRTDVLSFPTVRPASLPDRQSSLTDTPKVRHRDVQDSVRSTARVLPESTGSPAGPVPWSRVPSGARSRPLLAARTAERGAVHERLAHDGRAAAAARPVPPPVGVEPA